VRMNEGGEDKRLPSSDIKKRPRPQEIEKTTTGGREEREKKLGVLRKFG